MAKSAPKKDSKKPKVARCFSCDWYVGWALLKRYEGYCPNCGVFIEEV